MTKLFESYELSQLTLANRIVMAPMTRSRALGHAPTESTATYYAQRASAGLVITEGVPISPQARGFLWTPGIYTDEQVDGWRRVTEAVHQAGGRIYAQLWHVGRVSHTSLQENGQAPVSSVDSQVSTKWPVFAYDEVGNPGQTQASPARKLTVQEIHATIQDFVQAAQNAMTAGFDGIELHSAGGFLLDQFISGAINTRDDEYGGERIANRLRFVLEIVDAVSKAIGSHRVGIRITPEGRLHDAEAYPSEHETFLTLAAELSKRNIAYLHIFDMGVSPELLSGIRKAFQGTLIIAGGYTHDKAQATIEGGKADLVAFGRPYIGNPDLVERLRNGWPLVEAGHEAFYGGSDHGYIDFPAYEPA
ncbi:alkene reductase [Ralstonia pseudosolanacearum]|uniref:alkene reductase n=1 Tax=Ralstonia pseudosolanacearum TaxID=1310165 RepID=UPI002003DA50|nr:alkene reductase [Ralstonia pseudosolanacearum]MCK4141942.1 alkene reductase [Ralstonia pseudosolanacearum]